MYEIFSIQGLLKLKINNVEVMTFDNDEHMVRFCNALKMK